VPAETAPPADDAGLTIVVSMFAAVLITLVDGKTWELYGQMVYSICIGLVALGILDGVRLTVLDDPARRRRWMVPSLVLLEQPDGDGLAQPVEQMRALLPAQPAAERLTVIRAAVGNIIRMIPVQDVAYFQALDKYVNVASSDGDALIRLSLKDLLPQLDPDLFRQVSRGAIVNLRHVTSASRDDAGKLTLHLRGRADKLRVSPLFAHLFRQM
jgi:hypothetical protein